MEKWIMMGSFLIGTRAGKERSQEHGQVSPLVWVFSLPWVSFHQLQSLPCQHDLTDGNTQLHLLGLVINSRDDNTLLGAVPCPCSPLNSALLSEM